MNTSKQAEPAPGDYYGVVYKGGFIVPILGIILVVALWWFLRKGKSTK